MTIAFGSETLAQPGREGVTDFRLSHQRAVQEDDLIRAEGPYQKERGNRRVEVTFGNAIEHSSLDDAQAHLLDLEASLPGQDDLTITIDSDIYTIEDAVLVGLELGHEGHTTFQRYTFRGRFVVPPVEEEEPEA